MGVTLQLNCTIFNKIFRPFHLKMVHRRNRAQRVRILDSQYLQAVQSLRGQHLQGRARQVPAKYIIICFKGQMCGGPRHLRTAPECARCRRTRPDACCSAVCCPSDFCELNKGTTMSYMSHYANLRVTNSLAIFEPSKADLLTYSIGLLSRMLGPAVVRVR